MKILYINVDGEPCYLCNHFYSKPVEKGGDESNIFSTDFEEVWSNSQYLDLFSEVLNIKFEYRMVHNKPFIVTASGVNLTAIFEFAKGNNFDINNDELVNQIVAVLNKNDITCYPDDVKDLIYMFKQFNEYVNNDDMSICTDISSNFKIDPDVKKLIEKQQNGYPNPANNQTLFMNTEESEVYVKIPNYNQVHLGDYNLPKIPDYTPKKPNNKDSDSGNSSNEDSSDDNIICKPYEKVLNPEICCTPIVYELFETDSSAIAFEDVVLGSPMNNNNFNQEGIPEIYKKDENGIYPNEKRYYDDLVKLVTFSMTNGGENPDMDGDCSEGKEPEIKDYLIQLAERFAAINWMHTGKIPVSRGRDDDDDEDGSSDDGDLGSLGMYAPHDLKNTPIDPRYVLSDIYNMTKNIKSPESFAELLIKLLRWGNRKPTSVVWSNSKIGVEFDLERFILVRKNEFNIFEAKQAEFEGGYAYRLSGLIRTGKPLECPEVSGITVAGSIIGIIVDRRFEYKDSDGNNKYEYQKIYMSLLDALELLNEDEKAIQHINLDGNQINVDIENLESYRLGEAINIVNQNRDQMQILHQSKRISSLFLTLGVAKNAATYLTILDRCLFYKEIDGFIKMEFSDSEDAAKKIKRERMLAVENHIFAKIYKYFINLLEFDGSAMERLTLDKMLNRLKGVVGDSLNQPLFSDKGSVGTASARTALAQHMNIGEKEGVTMAEAKQLYRDVMVKSSDFESFAPVYFNKSDIETPEKLKANVEIYLGVANNNGKRQYVIYHKDTLPEDIKIMSNAKQALTRLLLALSMQQSSMILGHWENCQFVFGNTESVGLFGKYIQSILNRRG